MQETEGGDADDLTLRSEFLGCKLFPGSFTLTLEIPHKGVSNVKK